MDGTTPEIIPAAWEAFGAPQRLVEVVEISAEVSTNNVYRVVLSDNKELIAKVSSYGSYVHFRQDHEIIHQWSVQLSGTRYRDFLAPIVLCDGKVFTFRRSGRWLVFYQKVPFYDFLPKVLSESQVRAMGHEMARFHKACTRVGKRLRPTWKSVGSDIANLYDAAGSEQWRAERDLPDEVEDVLKAHCDAFLQNAETLGYYEWKRLPILIDWNIGNFSVGFDRDGFKLFSRWDYDWFRIEPRTFDFYFCSRVVRSSGDQTVFSYTTGPMLESPFIDFLRAYHEVSPLEEAEVLFLKEAYRFFILNYVVRSGEHFFRHSIHQRLLAEATQEYLPSLETFDLSSVARAVVR